MTRSNQLLNKFGIDFFMSILFAVLKSYKCSSLMKPLPSFIQSPDELVDFLDSSSYPNFSSNDKNFSDWLLENAQRYEVLTCHPDNIEKMGIVVPLNSKNKPNYVVRIKDPRLPPGFSEQVTECGSSIGYHGTHTENIFSILQNGLSGHMSKRALFGAGTYLSNDLDVAFSFATQGKSWPRSLLGRDLKCVLVCQAVKSQQVRQGKDKLAGISLDTDTLPHNYFVVENNDHVAVTHILLYLTKVGSGRDRRAQGGRIRQFFRCYGVVLLYGLILLFVCSGSKVWNSRKWF